MSTCENIEQIEPIEPIEPIPWLETDLKNDSDGTSSKCKCLISGDTNVEFSWMGKYTHGMSDVRGTRLWLTEEAGIRYKLSQECEWVFQSPEEQKEMTHLHGSVIFSRGGCLDEHSTREVTPKEFFNNKWFTTMENEKCLLKELEELNGGWIPELPDFDEYKTLLIQRGTGDIIWFGIHNLQAIKNELSSIERLGMESGVEFIWI